MQLVNQDKGFWGLGVLEVDQRKVRGYAFQVPVEIMYVSKENNVFRFLLSDGTKPLGLKIGESITIQGKIEGTTVQRNYHPISKQNDQGFIDLLIKIYRKDFSNPTGGIFTQYLDSLKEGDILKIPMTARSVEY